MSSPTKEDEIIEAVMKLASGVPKYLNPNDVVKAIKSCFTPKKVWPKEGNEFWWIDYNGAVGQSKLINDGLLGIWPTEEGAEAFRDLVRALEKGEFNETQLTCQQKSIETKDGDVMERFIKAHAERNELKKPE